jgi:hypothetical protein
MHAFFVKIIGIELPTYRSIAGASAALLLTVIGSACAEPADEQALETLWQYHVANIEHHTDVAAACKRYETQHHGDPLVVVSQGIAAWHLFNAGDTNAAIKVLMPTLDRRRTDLQRFSSDVARSWISRMDMLKLKAALKEYYRDEVAFPAKLSQLNVLDGAHTLRFADRWQTDWGYKLVGFRKLPGLRDQKYRLTCQRLGSRSDLHTALAIPYASRITLQPVKEISTSSGTVVEFTSPTGNPLVMSLGTRDRGIVFAYLGKRILLLSDGDHWSLLPRPGRRQR